MIEIQVRNLRKNFGKIEALKGISFEVLKGEVVALLGPNGAGKTTTCKILTGLILSYQGEVRYRGKLFSPFDRYFKGLMGVVPQHNNLDRELTVYQNLKLHGLLFGLDGRALERRIGEVLELAGLKEHSRRKADELSGGMKRRLIIARALLHNPEILFLDEPTVGLDPAVRRGMWDFVLGLNSEGKTVVLTTHYIEEADVLAHRVFIMDRGRIVCSGKPRELKNRLGRFVLEKHTPSGIEEEFFQDRESAIQKAKTLDCEVRVREVTLEDVFLHYTGRRIEV